MFLFNTSNVSLPLFNGTFVNEDKNSVLLPQFHDLQVFSSVPFFSRLQEYSVFRLKSFIRSLTFMQVTIWSLCFKNGNNLVILLKIPSFFPSQYFLPIFFRISSIVVLISPNLKFGNSSIQPKSFNQNDESRPICHGVVCRDNFENYWDFFLTF